MKKVDPLDAALGTAKRARPTVGKARTTSMVMERYQVWVRGGSKPLGGPDDTELNDAAPILFGYFAELVRCLGDRRPSFKMDDVRTLRDAIYNLLDEMEFNAHTRRRINEMRGEVPFYDFVFIAMEALFTKGFSGFTFRPSVLFKWGLTDDGEYYNGLDEYVFGAVANIRRRGKGTLDGWRGEVLDRLQRSGGSVAHKASRTPSGEDILRRMQEQMDREKAEANR